ncbi:hypothetical protein GBAR_LOCUS21211 [Geodia barretti]|uniref:Uncharacterized protein n=1 Tax=Geodia barretti TaxID=519541 RepID=A0AA35WXZ7_GEOBA|nr:hypothetical protein GBAR_LOCUS21211 [Geodia barretti]
MPFPLSLPLHPSQLPFSIFSPLPCVHYKPAVFKAFALPSAGALPFLQSAICDFRGQPTTNYSDMPVYHNASVNQFYSLLEETDVLQSWNGVCSQLEEQLGCFSAEARLLACQQQNPIHLDCTLRDPNDFSHFLSHDLGLSPQTAEDIIGAQVRVHHHGNHPTPWGYC